jgi:hypothetical protein
VAFAAAGCKPPNAGRTPYDVLFVHFFHPAEREDWTTARTAELFLVFFAELP